MKRLMFAMAAASAMFAAQATLTSTADFETETAGDPLNVNADAGDAVWACASATSAGNVEDAVITAYETAPTGLGELGSQYLKLDGAPKIERYAQVGGAAADIGDGMYIDAVVQFTATDADTTSPTFEAGVDKLVVWLKATDDAGTNGNVMVTAGRVNDAIGGIEVMNYATTTVLENNSWHKLQVKAISGIDEEGLLTDGFVVLIDGTAVVTSTNPFSDAATGYTLVSRASRYFDTEKEVYSLFPSLLDYNNTTAASITSLAFQGSGAVDNIAFTAGDPDPIVIAADDMPHAIPDLVENGQEQDGVAGNLEDTAYEFSSGVTKATAAGNYEAIASVKPGYAWSDGTTADLTINWSIADGSAPAVNVTVPTSATGDWTATVDPATAKAGDSITVTYTAKAGYHFKNGKSTMDATGTLNSDGTISFTEEPDTEVAADLYAVNFAEMENGAVETSVTNCAAGTSVTITVSPAASYELDDLIVSNATAEVEVTQNAFTMPSENVTIYATFKVVESSDPITPPAEDTPTAVTNALENAGVAANDPILAVVTTADDVTELNTLLTQNSVTSYSNLSENQKANLDDSFVLKDVTDNKLFEAEAKIEIEEVEATATAGQYEVVIAVKEGSTPVTLQEAGAAALAGKVEVANTLGSFGPVTSGNITDITIDEGKAKFKVSYGDGTKGFMKVNAK